MSGYSSKGYNQGVSVEDIRRLRVQLKLDGILSSYGFPQSDEMRNKCCLIMFIPPFERSNKKLLRWSSCRDSAKGFAMLPHGFSRVQNWKLISQKAQKDRFYRRGINVLWGINGHLEKFISLFRMKYFQRMQSVFASDGTLRDNLEANL